MPRAAAQGAGDTVDVLETAHLRHDLGDLRRVLDIEPHDDGRRLVAAVRVGVDAVDVDLHLRRHGKELCEHAALVVADDLNLDRVVLVEADIPADLDHAREVVVAQDVRAVRAVDGDAAALGDEARDRVAGDRVAAAGQADEQAALALDEHAVARAVALADVLRRLELREHLRDIGRRGLLEYPVFLFEGVNATAP